MARRKRPTLEERKAPCSACGFKLSHRHHVTPIGDYGTNEIVIPLCANCHEIYHIVYDLWNKKSPRAAELFLHLFDGIDLKEDNRAIAPLSFAIDSVLTVAAQSTANGETDMVSIDVVKTLPAKGRIQTLLNHAHVIVNGLDGTPLTMIVNSEGKLHLTALPPGTKVRIDVWSETP